MRKSFIENEEEVNEKRQYAHTTYKNISTEKRTKCVNMPVKNIEAFTRRKKTKSVNMLVNDIENSLKDLTFCSCIKKYFL